MLRVADSILGSDLLQRVSEFLLDLRTTYDGVAQRGREIENVMREAAILVVTTSDPAPVTEAVRFYRELPVVASTPAAVVFNRALPDQWIETSAPEESSNEIKQVATWWSMEAHRQRDAREEFSSRHGARVATVPWTAKPPTDLDDLAGLIEQADDLPWDRLGFGDSLER